MSKQSGTIVCGLTEWAVNVPTRGRKSENKMRWILMLADKRNWSIAIEREGYPPIGQKFNSSLGKLLISSGGATTGHSLDEMVRHAVKEVSAWLGVSYDFGKKTTIEILEEIDGVFHTDLLSDSLNPKVAEMLGATAAAVE